MVNCHCRHSLTWNVFTVGEKEGQSAKLVVELVVQYGIRLLPIQQRPREQGNTRAQNSISRLSTLRHHLQLISPSLSPCVSLSSSTVVLSEDVG